MKIPIVAILTLSTSAFALTVDSKFEGASIAEVKIEDASHTISFMPGGDPVRGWPCWWYFRVNGTLPGETITLRLHGSTATVPKAGSPLSKALAAAWAMPAQATFSLDGKTWRHTDKGIRDGEWMIYTLKPESASAYVAWGPPYTPETSANFVREMSLKSPHAKAEELCRSREDRAVPMLHVQEGELPKEKRFGVWVEARQHAWESGSSWVAQGFAEWLLSADADAAWLRQHAEIYLVPIMDIDNTATGNGGKEADPHDHNRDWSAAPVWKESAAAQKMVSAWVKEGRMDIFLDLHNPGPTDPIHFYTLPDDFLKEPMASLRTRFIQLTRARIAKITPPMPMLDKPKISGANYHPLWRQISNNWVSVNGNPQTVSLCLETTWNSPSSTTDGYRKVGANLAAAVKEYLAERPSH